METKIKKPSLLIFFVCSTIGGIIPHIIHGKYLDGSISCIVAYWIGGLLMYYNFIQSNGNN